MDKLHYKKLVEKYLEGQIVDHEIKELAEWIKNDPQLQKWWEEEFVKSDALMDAELRDRLFEQIKQVSLGIDRTVVFKETDTKQHKKSLQISLWRWVAIVCIPICIAFFVYQLVYNPQMQIAPIVVKADRGDKATIELPDGSHVVLNSGSGLRYLNDFRGKERRVALEGEAYFKVAHDEKHPFIVQAGEVEVKVLGTSFNVNAYQEEDKITVVLLEGVVDVYTKQLSRIMKPGDKVVYNKESRQMVSDHVQPDDYIEWTKGNLYFEKESLKNIMKVLSRMYDVQIRFDSATLSEEHFSGTIPGGGIQNALNILMLASHFRYEVEGSVIVLKEK